VVFWDSAGTSRFKGPKRGTPYAAQIATKNAIRMLVKQGMRRGEIMIKGAGPGRYAALKTVLHSGLKIKFIRDVTPIPHNGCRPPKRRRV
jgi:small subunit ribosomal protein S11